MAKSMPLYYKMVEALKAQIESGELQPGNKLQTEKHYCDFFKISRVTVRRSLEELCKSNYIIHKPNVGYFVAEGKQKKDFTRSPSVYSELTAKGFNVRSVIIKMELTQAGPGLASKLNCNETDCLMMIKRVRYANEKPFAVQSIWLKENMFPNFNPWLLQADSLRRIMEEDYNYSISRTEDQIDACMPTPSVMKNLQMKSEKPLVHIKTTACTSDGDVCEYSETYFLTEEFSYTVAT
ncbi:MAG: GntR family transcriptional regulator [Oscillospiraceae bacterium]|nr:GntR family transcriptional regulator [Oscillospiraceae bacterium]